jgi:anti-sigma regulatory factor (Ser/Thr protein kinase)
VRVRIRRRGALHLCTVEDNSCGFDLAAWLDSRPELACYARTLPDGGMGLLLLEASTERVEYEVVGEHWNRLRLSVRTRPRLPVHAGDRKIPEG